MRTVRVTYRPSTFGDKVVRFQGSTFGELQQRLIAARVPYVHSMSFIELSVPNEGFVCPLASEKLPEIGDLTVAVHGEAHNVHWFHKERILHVEDMCGNMWLLQTYVLLPCSGQDRSEGSRAA